VLDVLTYICQQILPKHEAERIGSVVLLHELHDGDRFQVGERFQPYEKHHSTVLDAARLAEQLSVKNLILYHTEDRTLSTRRERYTAEAKTVFHGNGFVPEDTKIIQIG
jgi:ribonuclease Z